ncbi:hypothetical protein MA16_Dca027071 [Dendrobium catenatum]|uniref:Uncharacterized protein n=1 Tax=Dendrobium catenatum TaxID=906689 RepID=A0A2I0WZK9_9ASPA|nr:hypothetical protein MA16_Dca027071 [Dendrobium catenatum]
MTKSQNVEGIDSDPVDLVLKEGEQLGLVNLVKEVEVNPTTNVSTFSALNLDNTAIDPIANGNDNIVNESSSNLVPSLNLRIHQEDECSSRGPDPLVLNKWQDAIIVTSSDNLVVVLDLGEVESSKANELPNTNELDIAKNDSSLQEMVAPPYATDNCSKHFGKNISMIEDGVLYLEGMLPPKEFSGNPNNDELLLSDNYHCDAYTDTEVEINAKCYAREDHDLSFSKGRGKKGMNPRNVNL